MANFAPGGFSTGFARGAAVAQGKSQLKLQEQELEAAKQKQAQDRMRSAYDTSMGNAEEAFSAAMEQITEAAAVLDDPQKIDQLRAYAMAVPMQHARFLAEIQARAVQAGATEEQLALIPSAAEYLEMRNLEFDNRVEIASLVGRANLGQQQFREGDEFVTRRTRRGVADMTDDGVLARSPISQVQRVEQGGPGAFSDDARTASQRGEATAESIEDLEDSQRAIVELVGLGSAVSQTPRVAGATGALNELVGGAIGQISPAVAAGLSMMLTGTDPQRAAQLRTNFRTLISQNLSMITGEESGRFTEQERAIAEQAIRTIPLGASADQILGAFGALMSAQLSREMRELIRQEKPLRFDFLSGSGEKVQVGGQTVSVDTLGKLDTFLIDAGIASPAVRDSVARFLIASQAQGAVPIQ